MNVGAIKLRSDDVVDVFEITARADVMIRLKRIFKQANHSRSGHIELTATPDAARDLEWVLTRYPMELVNGASECMKRQADASRESERMVAEILTGNGAGALLGEPHCEKREYQEVAATLCLNTGGLLCMDDVGLGKTITSLLMLGDPGRRPAMVACQTHLQDQWKQEIATVWPFMRVHIVRKMYPYDPAQTREMKGYDPDVLIVPYSKLAGWRSHLAGKIRTVIFDEVQELRRKESNKYSAAGEIADPADVVMGLSATPIYNYGDEIFNIMSVIAPDALGSRYEFMREWCGVSERGKSKVHDPKALRELLEAQGRVIRRTRPQVGRELPATIPTVVPVDTNEETYDAVMSTADGLAKLILGGGKQKEVWTARGEFDNQMRKATGIAKAAHVATFTKMLLEGNDEKVVLFGWHHDVYDIWREELADFNPVLYTGKESRPQKRASEEAFKHGESRLLIMSLRSGSGLDGLQEHSNIAIFGELDWSPAIHYQCTGRLRRDGMDGTEPVVAYYLVSRVGSDPLIADVLNVKRQQSEPFVDPDAQLFEPVKADKSDQVRKLAEEFLRRRQTKGLT